MATKKRKAAKPKTRGTLHKRETMFLRMSAGEATRNDGTKFELSTNMVGGNPIIRCESTGLWWSINWHDLIDMAVESGIDNPQEFPS